MSQHFSTHDGSAIVADLVSVIVANREYLSEVDGAIGDGDHGINMAKGFAHCGRTIEGRQLTLAEALDELTLSLMEGIGGSMGRCMAACLSAWRMRCAAANRLTRRPLPICCGAG